jgi:hypothetical protein
MNCFGIAAIGNPYAIPATSQRPVVRTQMVVVILRLVLKAVMSGVILLTLITVGTNVLGIVDLYYYAVALRTCSVFADQWDGC